MYALLLSHIRRMAYVRLGFQFVNEFVYNLRCRYNVYIQRYLNVFERRNYVVF